MTTYTAQRPEREPTHPGELLPDIIKEIGFSATRFAEILHISRGLLYQIIRKDKPITTDTALKLGALVGNGPVLWLNMQRSWDIWKSEKTLKPILKEIKKVRASSH